MLFRSTNGKFTHFQGDVVSNVDDSSHGVMLSGGSTGGVVSAVGDETNIALTVQGKGSGGVKIGTSTSGILLMNHSRIQFTIPALSSAGQGAAESTMTLTGATTNAIYLVQQRIAYNSTDAVAIQVTARCSTANELRLMFWNHGASSLSGSTASAHLLQIGI